MAEYIVKGESLTAIADKIRVLSGTEEAMGLDDMATNVGEANNEIQTQSTLLSEQDAKIAELAEVLANKAGGGSASIDTCTVNISTNGTIIDMVCLTVNESGMIVCHHNHGYFNTKTITCPCRSYIVLKPNSHYKSNCTNANMVGRFGNDINMIYFITASKNETAYIFVDTNPGGGEAD